MDCFAVAVDQRRHTRDRAAVDIRLHRRRQPPQPLSRKSTRTRHFLPQAFDYFRMSSTSADSRPPRA